MATITSFEELEAWKEARSLARRVYELTRQADFSRDFSLRDQIRRSVVSIAANIAEGFERDGSKEFVQFLSHAKGSTGETISHLWIALDQDYIDRPAFEAAREEALKIGRMVASLMKYLRTSDIRGAKFRHEPRESNPTRN